MNKAQQSKYFKEIKGGFTKPQMTSYPLPLL